MNECTSGDILFWMLMIEDAGTLPVPCCVALHVLSIQHTLRAMRVPFVLYPCSGARADAVRSLKYLNSKLYHGKDKG